MLLEGEFPEKVAADCNIRVVFAYESVAGGGGEGVIQIDDGPYGNVHCGKHLHALAGIAHAALTHEGAFDERKGLPGNAFEKGGEHSPFRFSFGEEHVVCKQKFIAVRKAKEHLQLAWCVLNDLAHGVFHSLAHKRSAFSVLADQ